MSHSLSKISRFLLSALIVLFPLFFLPVTQEFYNTNKFYFLGFGSLAAGVILIFNFLSSKKLSWKKTLFDGALPLLLTAYGISVLLMSPNKYQALVNPVSGFGTIIFFSFLFFLFSQEDEGMNFDRVMGLMTIPVVIVSLISVSFFFNPFANINLPSYLQFLKSATFTPIGGQLELAVFLGFFVAVGLTKLFKHTREHTSRLRLEFPLFVLTLIAFLLTAYTVVKPVPQSINMLQSLPPVSVSWFAVVETLKKPMTALFGVGPDNFMTIFTAVKPADYNMSHFWNINFNQSASAILQLWAETGLLGFIAFGFIVMILLREWSKMKPYEQAGLAYVLVALLILPVSLTSLFLFFMLLVVINNQFAHQRKSEFSVSHLVPVYLGIGIVSFILLGGAGYYLGKAYAAELYFKQSLNALSTNDAKTVYENQRNAVLMNPYIERFRINFGQLNLLIANNLASKKPGEITDQDKQNIAQGIQTAIAEAKAAVSLNSQRATNWENLAAIYRNIINAAQGADVWTISSYQRAIIADPQNPSHRLNLGGVYYSLGNFDEAQRFFEQTVSLKQDWANAHYNLAWTLFQKKNYPAAVAEMQNVLTLVNANSDDYKVVQKDLEEFKTYLPKQEANQGEVKPENLTLPAKPQPVISPKIKLPEEASPETR